MIIKTLCICAFVPLCLFNLSTPVSAKRIISISPVITEIIFWLEADDQLVGVTTACNYPKAAQSIATIGDFTQPNLEMMIVLKPDLIIGMGNTKSPDHIQMQKLGFSTEIFESPQTINAIFTVIQKTAAHLKKEALATQKIKALQRQLNMFHPPLNQQKTAITIIWYPPLIVAGKNTFISEIIHYAGGQNLIGDSPTQYPKINIEYLIQSNPDYLILTEPFLKKTLANNAMIQRLPAWKNHRIIDTINPDLLIRPGPRFIEGIKALAQQFNHP